MRLVVGDRITAGRRHAAEDFAIDEQGLIKLLAGREPFCFAKPRLLLTHNAHGLDLLQRGMLRIDLAQAIKIHGALLRLAALFRIGCKGRQGLVAARIREQDLLPAIHTVSIVRTFRILASGSLERTRRSAHLPFCSVPRSFAPRNSAEFFVAMGMIWAGVRPASAIDSSSTCSK